ncbi:unnamed protein product, partial [Didymodactylos carnosus]
NKWTVSLIGVNDVEYLKNDRLQKLRQEQLIPESNNSEGNADRKRSKSSHNILFGLFCMIIGHVRSCIRYFEKLLQRTMIDKWKRYTILRHLSIAYYFVNEFDPALKYALEANNVRLDGIFNGNEEWEISWNLRH